MTDVRPFEDRSDRMFGRERDLRALQDRVRFKGLTAVVGRPQMGKSWLLTELARRLAYEHNPSYAVGFAESFGQTPDLLSRAVADLYTRWLSDAGMAEQARMVWKQQKANLLGGIAARWARSSPRCSVRRRNRWPWRSTRRSRNSSPPTRRSPAADSSSRPRSTSKPAIWSRAARIGGRPVTLFLDQWEKTPDARAESHTLDAFLRHLDDWPACDIVMALRPDEPAYGIVESVGKSLPGAAQMRCSDGCGNLRRRTARTRPSASTRRQSLQRVQSCQGGGRTSTAATHCCTSCGDAPTRTARTRRCESASPWGLFNALIWVQTEGDIGRGDALLDELRALAENYPDDEFVQKVWRRAAEAMSGKD